MMATKPKAHNKVILKVGYKQYIIDAAAAFAFISAITECEEYTEEWNAESQVSDPMVSPLEDITSFSISMLTPERYAMGKLIHKAKQLKETNKEQQA